MRRPIVCLVVALLAALVGPRLIGPQSRSAGGPFAYEPPDGFVQTKDFAAEQQGARVWTYEGQGTSRREVRVVLTHSGKEMSVEEADLARLAEEMPAAFEGMCNWVQRRHEMRVRSDGARVGLIEGDCDRTVDLGGFGLGSAPVKGRKLQLMFPEDHGTWIATASYPTEDAARWEPLFEATIGKAHGVAVRVPAPPIWMPLVCAAAGAVLAWLATALFVRRSSAERQA